MIKEETPLPGLIKLFEYYRSLGQKTIDQISDDGLFWHPNEENNSIAVIVKHLHGNMLSRWTDFLITDGEKTWRDRDGEFDSTIVTKSELQQKYNEGWNVLMAAIKPLTKSDLNRIVYIRNQGHTVLEAMHRQLGHYAYHIGQIVFIGKMVAGKDWKTLSIARNASKEYNTQKFQKEKERKHFTDDV